MPYKERGVSNMMVSTKGRYALTVMVDLARSGGDNFVSLSDIAEREKLSMKYLESIISILNKGGMLTSLRGKNGGYKLANYLISLGHRRIGFIGSKTATSSIFDRYMGYLKALIEHDLEIRDDWIIEDRDKYSDPIDLVFPEDMPTAFVCNCDEAAFQAIKQLREHGYSVPEDVSVVGYDNYLISEVSDPTITTISIDAEYMAELTVNTLIQRLNDPSTVYRMRTIEGELVIKNSVLPLNRK